MGRRRAKSTGRANSTGQQAQPKTLLPRLARTEVLFAVTLFVSAALLFVVQPMFAKMVLPLLGGAPAVWNTCMVFYQAVLLAGYLYAHLSLKWLGPRRQAALHLLLLCLPWTVLPIGVAKGWAPPDTFPVVWLWMLLSVSVGLPFLVVSASAPTLQAWFGQTGSRSAADPYFLYAASNLGSLLALLCYPLAIESHLTLGEQSWAWAVGYGILMALAGGCAVRLWRSSPVAAPAGQTGRAEESAAERPTLRRRLRWLVLSLVPSSLLLGATTYISTDIAQIPLLWVLPLALYLLTFVLVFARRTILPLRWTTRVEPYLIVAAAATLAWHAAAPVQLLFVGSFQLLTFFVIAMVCHGQLAADRPAGSRLTEFYLWMSLGGVLGGLFNALAAPLIFSGAAEYPLMMAVACLLRPRTAAPRCGAWALVREVALPAAVLLVCGGLAWSVQSQAALGEWQYTDVPATELALVASAAIAAFSLKRRPMWFALGVAALLLVSLWYPTGRARLLHAERSFFGVLRVKEEPIWNAHMLQHGSTTHGSQGLGRDQRREPWAYYHRAGPLGRIFRALQSRRPLAEIGVLGLGTGAIAAYGQPGERITFYEIDPAVERIARNPEYFTYLADCRANVAVVRGDARLSLVRGPPRQFDLLAVDVFSSDTVPVHLITREALQTYFQRLAEHGLLAIHISSRYLDLEPILGGLAADAGAVARVCSDEEAEAGLERLSSTWVVMARRVEDLGPLAGDPAWKPLAADGGRVWTDDFSNVVGALRREASWSWLQPSAWCKSKEQEAGFHNYCGVVSGAQGRFDEAVAHFQKALDINPDFADAHYNCALALQSQGRSDEVTAHLRKALEIKPDLVEAHYNLGLVLQGQGNPDEAMVHFRKALEIQPDYAEAHYGLGNLLSGRKQFDEAAAHLRKALEIQPDHAEAHNNLGGILAGRGEVDEGIAHYRKALEIQPDYAEAHYNLGSILARRGQFDEAAAHLGKALEIQPNHAEAHNNLGLALRGQGRFSEAVAHFQKALELVPQDMLIRNNLAWLLATCPDTAVRDGAQAVRLAQQAVYLSGGGDPGLLDTLAAAYAEAGRFHDAVDAARKAVELATQRNQRTLAESLKAKIRLYEAETPYRETRSSPGAPAVQP